MKAADIIERFIDIFNNPHRFQNIASVKLRASTLYIVIVISLVIGIFCSSIILVSYYQRLQVQRNQLINRLHDNAESGINLLLGDYKGISSGDSLLFDLYDDERDSVIIKTNHWGIYDIASVRSFSGRLSNIKTILYGYKADETSKVALHLSDQNQQLALAGNTIINGTCYLPESGVKRAYIEGENFTGSNLINGTINKSKPVLPSLDKSITDHLVKVSTSGLGEIEMVEIEEKDTIIQSFQNGTAVVNASDVRSIANKRYEGNVIIYSKNILEIDSSCKLNDILIFAPSVILKNNFSGTVQVFCTDSILVMENCKLKYPSALGIIKKDFKIQQPFIKVKEKSVVGGILFSYVDVQDLQKTLINLDKNTVVEGQIYSDGFVDLKGKVYGSVFCNKIILKTPSSMYENHLLNTTIDYSKLSEYYIGSSLISSESNKMIVKWLE